MTSLEAFPQRHLAFISLALGFLVIWTAVLAGILVSRTLKEQATAEEAVKVFHTHVDMGRIAFALGHELVSTVDWLVSEGPESKETNTVTWNITDSVLSSVKSKSTNRWIPSSLSVLDTLHVKLGKVRGGLTSRSDPVRLVDQYSELGDLLIKKALQLDALSPHSMPYTLFVQGMTQRFGELSLGTVYIKSRVSLNKTQFLELRMGSETLMESAFRFTPRSHARWTELQDPRMCRDLAVVADDLLDGEVRRGRRQIAATYLEGVREQISILLLTKEVLNTASSAAVDRMSGNTSRTFAFHMSVAVVAVAAVLICILVTGFTFKSLSKAESKSCDDNFYCTVSDKAQMISSDYPRPQCYF